MWHRLNDWQVVGLDAHVQSGRVYLSTRGYVGFTEDLGMSWQQAGSNISRVELQRITVSPADPDYMTVWHVAANWNWKYLHTSDGGTTWADGVYDNSLSFMPYNVRRGLFAYHPEDPRVVSFAHALCFVSMCFKHVSVTAVHNGRGLDHAEHGRRRHIHVGSQRLQRSHDWILLQLQLQHARYRDVFLPRLQWRHQQKRWAHVVVPWHFG